MVDGDWNAWTIWNTAMLCFSFLTFGFYTYILTAVIIAAVEDTEGKYDESTALLNESYNMWIFFALNSIYFLFAILKFWVVQLVLESASPMDDEWLKWWNEFKFYVWDPDQRLELEIEMWAELVKIVVVAANYFIYW